MQKCQLSVSIIVVPIIFKNIHLFKATQLHNQCFSSWSHVHHDHLIKNFLANGEGLKERLVQVGINEGGGSCFKICIRIMITIFVIITVVITIVIRHKERRVRCWTPS